MLWRNNRWFSNYPGTFFRTVMLNNDESVPAFTTMLIKSERRCGLNIDLVSDKSSDRKTVNKEKYCSIIPNLPVPNQVFHFVKFRSPLPCNNFNTLNNS